MVQTTTITERAIREMSAKEICNILRITGKYPETKKKTKAIIIQVPPISTTLAVRALRDQKITCLCEQYRHNGKITVLREDLKRVEQILSETSIQYEKIS